MSGTSVWLIVRRVMGTSSKKMVLALGWLKKSPLAFCEEMPRM